MKTRGDMGQVLVTAVRGDVGPSSAKANAAAHQADKKCWSLEGDAIFYVRQSCHYYVHALGFGSCNHAQMANLEGVLRLGHLRR